MNHNWKRHILPAVAGNILELYEFIIYGYFTSIIGDLFFPAEDKLTSILAALAVFAAGSVIRPFSAIFLGYFGDKVGRRASLILSIGIMAFATMGIGLLPVYAQISIAAPVLLLVFRMLQGISMTGEEVGAALYLVENSPDYEKAFASSFILGSVFIGLYFGSIISALVFSLLGDDALTSWGWRLPFILGGCLGFLVLIRRIRQPESEEFKAAMSRNEISKNPVKDLVGQYKFSVIRLTLLSAVYAVTVYLFAVYIPAILIMAKIIKQKVMIMCSTCFLLTFIISLISGKIADKFGSTIPLIISTTGLFLLSYPIFYCLSGASIISIFFAYILLAILLGLNAGSIMIEMIKPFPTSTRFSGCCISFNLGMSLFGGVSPVLAMYLTQYFHNPVAPAFIVMAAAILTLFAVLVEKQNQYNGEFAHANQNSR
ncbi:MAG TPA: MFS transporter [Gammaproteobacteria bacterium]|jgi:MHS family proline/betaine transporter-like MFS transporter|nr:MFS transporter [Gammaproteobacteria bacterium]